MLCVPSLHQHTSGSAMFAVGKANLYPQQAVTGASAPPQYKAGLQEGAAAKMGTHAQFASALTGFCVQH